MFCWQLIVGGILSATVTKAVVVEMFPYASVAVKVTGVAWLISAVETTLVAVPIILPVLAIVKGVISLTVVLVADSSNL